MCCCAKPNVNGEPGYSWDGKTFSVCQPHAPELADNDRLLYDLPGRCGGCDSHSYHFRVTTCGDVLVRHGGGVERFSIGSHRPAFKLLASLDDNGRYWFVQLVYHVQNDAKCRTGERISHEWATAIAEKRIKKQKRGNSVRVSIEARA